MRSVCNKGSQVFKTECLCAFSNHFHATCLTVMAHFVHIHMLQSHVEIEDYSVAYFNRIAEFKVPYR